MSNPGAHITNRQKIAAAIFFLLVLYLANRGHNEVSKSPTQRQYESWLTETEAKTRASLNNEALPALSLTIIPQDPKDPAKEKIINANNISDSKDKILRLLSLINEAGLYRFQTAKLNTNPGDIILKIDSPGKDFTLKFTPESVQKNIKAALFFKLYDEYSKDRIPENLAQNKASGLNIKDSIFAAFEEQDAKSK